MMTSRLVSYLLKYSFFHGDYAHTDYSLINHEKINDNNKSTSIHLSAVIL